MTNVEDKIKNLIKKLKTNYNCNCNFRLDYYENENENCYYAFLLSGLNNKIIGKGKTITETFNDLEVNLNYFILCKQNLEKYELFINGNYMSEEDVKKITCCFDKRLLYQYMKALKGDQLSIKNKEKRFFLKQKILWSTKS